MRIQEVVTRAISGQIKWFQAAEILPTRDALVHEQVVFNDMAVQVDDPEIGHTIQVGIPFRLSLDPPNTPRPRPAVGQHNAEVFAEQRGRVPDVAVLCFFSEVIVVIAQPEIRPIAALHAARGHHPVYASEPAGGRAIAVVTPGVGAALAAGSAAARQGRQQPWVWGRRWWRRFAVLFFLR